MIRNKGNKKSGIDNYTGNKFQKKKRPFCKLYSKGDNSWHDLSTWHEHDTELVGSGWP